METKAYVYLFDSTKENNRGTFFNNAIVQGYSEVDNLDDTLDTMSLTLCGLEQKKEFAPTTRFIIDLGYFVDNDKSKFVPLKTLNMVVKQDYVEKPILSKENYYNHNIDLIEAGAIAQQRIVDNISFTYKLKDVQLNQEITYSTTDIVGSDGITNAEFTNPHSFGDTYADVKWIHWDALGYKWEWEMPDYSIWSYYKNSSFVNNSGETTSPFIFMKKKPSANFSDITSIFANYSCVFNSSNTAYTIGFPLPRLKISKGVQNTNNQYAFVGYASYKVVVNEISTGKPIPVAVERRDVNGNTIYVRDEDGNLEIWTTNVVVNPQSDLDGTWHYNEVAGADTVLEIEDGELVSYSKDMSTALGGGKFIKKSKVANYVSSSAVKSIGFRALPNCKYEIKMYFTELKSSGYKYDNFPNYYHYYKTYGFDTYTANEIISPIDTLTPSFTFNVNMYQYANNFVYSTKSAPPISAYDLFVKCVGTSQRIHRNVDISYETQALTNFDYYLSENDINELKQTKIVENIYQQKNLWEIFMEIGKYIHARPVVKFSETKGDRRFLLTFKKYGQTDQHINLANRISIFNSRDIQEYISSISCYASNLVQLGGQITEYVPIKTTSDQYLVYNDVAEIIVSKPIIEIDKVSIIYNNEEYDITKNVYAKNIWQLLSVDSTIIPNKGLGIYYELGDNKIQGLNYRLPSENNDTLYAFTNILKSIGIDGITTYNDVNIKVVYKTSDTARVNQTRPDLRKYLCNNAFDIVPMHYQFSNQTDKNIDSVKLGNQIYGQLIRTGNTSYQEKEWIDNVENLKKAGELYKVEGDLYYVSKVKNFYYSTYIISEVEYSKDFNKLSQIIGIPSEPRFYEISEQSMVRREVSIDDYIMLSTKQKVSSHITHYYNTDDVRSYILEKDGSDFDNVLIEYENDNNSINNSNENKNYYTFLELPVHKYSLQNTLCATWDMVDNFNAGDNVGDALDKLYTKEGNYKPLRAVRYGDVYGRADYFRFVLKNKYVDNELVNGVFVPTQKLMNSLPDINYKGLPNLESHFRHNDFAGTNDTYILLLKDNREALSFNYNLQMLTDSDRFVLSSSMFTRDKGTIYLALLKTELNKICNDVISKDDILGYTEYNPSLMDTISTMTQKIGSDFIPTTKAIALIYFGINNSDNTSSYVHFVYGRNVSGLKDDILTDESKYDDTYKLCNWYLRVPEISEFTKQ